MMALPSIVQSYPWHEKCSLPHTRQTNISQIRVASRPHPVIDLGPIDSSCAVILCDLQQKDCPIVYASDPFYLLTGYSSQEVIGCNCRFLQAPGGKVRKGSTRQYVDKEVLRQMKRSVEKNTEVQVEVPNFKKNGARFINLLTIIPVRWDGPDYRYAVGLQCDKED